MPIHDAAYKGSPCALQVLASSAISLAKFVALVSMITWCSRTSAARGIVRRLTITTSVHELATSKVRTSLDPTCPVPPTTKTRKPVLCLSPRNIAGGIFKHELEHIHATTSWLLTRWFLYRFSSHRACSAPRSTVEGTGPRSTGNLRIARSWLWFGVQGIQVSYV